MVALYSSPVPSIYICPPSHMHFCKIERLFYSRDRKAFKCRDNMYQIKSQMLQLIHLNQLTTKKMENIVIREVRIDDLDRCFEIESQSYQGDEAASREKIRKRISVYPEGFVVLEVSGEVVGFINSGATDTVELSNEQFKELIGHDPEGTYIVIMSVVVHPAYQRNGFAGKLLEYFVDKMKNHNKAGIYLICQEQLIDLYAKYGFKYLSSSNSDHGGLSWHEMALSLNTSKAD